MEELVEAAARTAALLREVPDASAPVPGLAWTAAETAAHLVADLEDYAALLNGAELPHPAEVGASRINAAANAGQLDRFRERDLSRLADDLAPAVEKYLAAAAEHPGERFLATNGVVMSVPVITAILIGEQLIHGLDIARAAGLPWTITRSQALRVIPGLMEILPDYVDHRRAAGPRSFELRFRGGNRYRLFIENGAAAVTAPGEPVDCWISADPVSFLLVGFGRSPQIGHVLRGRIVAGGRKPWRALAFGSLVTPP
ncbi:maleylpyruvate isomerase family mycothiol-dependent enzyme [Kutzneria buriramensis]|uniref:Uncharacterized protein (TIGR03083 family) n=1 Tax=Kutzneria buriramensis TaxID=1045776 RepID=A0A3E0H7L2_9PSEU|nr:maleylpyruvate isomerase family mycothiol-dependent enzyme [Kutzneria buriramensis]REH39267.1 uncharacterized protein (TIGR03083 family) [Kutzneria buriramensis]